jgi:hypothetical protein
MSIVKDPKGRYPLGIIESPPLAIHNDEGTGFWILDRDGKAYFGHQLAPPETGFGVTRKLNSAPPALMESAADLINSMYEAMEADFEGEDDEAFHRLPEILMAGMGMTDDEAHDHAEMILEESDRLGACPWMLAAMYISGVGWNSEKPTSENKPPEQRPDAKVIPFPANRIVRPPQ